MKLKQSGIMILHNKSNSNLVIYKTISKGIIIYQYFYQKPGKNQSKEFESKFEFEIDQNW